MQVGTKAFTPSRESSVLVQCLNPCAGAAAAQRRLSTCSPPTPQSPTRYLSFLFHQKGSERARLIGDMQAKAPPIEKHSFKRPCSFRSRSGKNEAAPGNDWQLIVTIEVCKEMKGVSPTRYLLTLKTRSGSLRTQPFMSG
jgi:hypothetical protein